MAEAPEHTDVLLVGAGFGSFTLLNKFGSLSSRVPL